MGEQNDDQVSIFSILGEEGIAAMVAAFYKRVRLDPILGPMYPPDDWEGSETRLRLFLIFRLGGSERYLEVRGHPRLRARHMPFRIDRAARDRWLLLMAEAMHDASIPPPVQEVIMPLFVQIADAMRNHPG